MKLFTLLSATMLTINVQAQQKKDSVPAVKQLKEVNVTATVPVITMQGGTMVMNVSKSAAAAGSTAWEVLQKAPGVIADNTNNLQLNGKSVTVYIDGRPSRLSGEDLKTFLNSTPSANIDKLELMSNPSAKYDAQGAAIINIKMLKNKDFGTNGTVNLSAGLGRYPRTSEGFTLNHRSNSKVNFYGGYDHLYTKQFIYTSSHRLFPDGSTMEDNDYTRENRHSHNVKAGADIDISKNTSAGLLVKGSFSNRGRWTENTTGLNAGADSVFFQLAEGDQSIVNPSINLYFKTGSEKKKNELIINADYFSYRKDWDDAFDARYFDAAKQPIGEPAFIRNNSLSDIRLYSASADYTQTFKFAKLEAGIKTTFTKTDNDMIWENKVDGSWQNDAGRTNRFIYRENVNAAYAGLSKTIKKFTFNAVLRAEHTNASGNSLTADKKFNRDYVQLFPSAGISYMKDPMNQFSFSYRSSINRFGYEIVNPFITYKNAYTYIQGNPDIRPVLTQSIEATWSHKYQLFTTLGFSRSKDNLSMVFRQDPATKILVMSYDNQASFNVAYATIVFTRPVLQKLRTTWTLTGLYLDVNTILDGMEFRKRNLGAMINTQNALTLPAGLTAELNGSLQTPFTFGYASLRTVGYIDLGLRKSIMKGSGSLKLAVNDVFNTRQNRFEVKYGAIDNFSKMNTDTRLVNLTFNYSFGNRNVKQNKVRKSTIEAEAGRTRTQTM